eukprot:361169-Chlamydomonas_euryale.AAC.1
MDKCLQRCIEEGKSGRADALGGASGGGAGDGGSGGGGGLSGGVMAAIVLASVGGCGGIGAKLEQPRGKYDGQTWTAGLMQGNLRAGGKAG